MTPPRALLSRLREHATDCDQLAAAHRALDEAHAAKWPPALVEMMGFAAQGFGVDERPPELEPAPKAKRVRKSKPEPKDWTTPVLPEDERARLLALTVPELVSAARQLQADQLAQLRAACSSDPVRLAALARL